MCGTKVLLLLLVLRGGSTENHFPIGICNEICTMVGLYLFWGFNLCCPREKIFLGQSCQHSILTNLISTSVKHEILIQSLHSSKIPRFWQAKIGHGILASKNLVLMKYPEILTGAKLQISIRCRPKIFVFFKNSRILTSKIGHWFLVSKTWFLWNNPRFWRV